MAARLARAILLATLLLAWADVRWGEGVEAAPVPAEPEQSAAPAGGPAALPLEPMAFLAGGPVRLAARAGEHVLLARGNALETWHVASGRPVDLELLPSIVTAFAVAPESAAQGDAAFRRAVVVCEGGLSVLWLAASGQLWTLAHHDGTALAPDGFPGGFAPEWQRGIAIAGDFVYLTRTGGFGGMRNSRVLLVVAALGEDGSLGLVAEQDIGIGGVGEIVVRGDRLYGLLEVGGGFGSTGGSLWQADISRRHLPRIEPLRVRDAAGQPVQYSALTDLALYGERLLVTDFGPTGAGARPDEPGTFRVIDPGSDPSQAREVARVPVEHVPTALGVDGTQALVLSHESLHGSALREPRLLLRLDLGPAAEPPVVASAELGHGASSLALAGDRAILGTEGGDVAFYDLPRAAGPRLRALHQGPGAVLHVAADGTVAALLRAAGRGATEVELLDVRDPTRPRVVARIAGSGAVSRLALRDGLLVLVDEGAASGRIRVFDVSDPASPRSRGRLDWEPRGRHGHIQALAWRDTRSLVLASRSWLGILDLSDPDAPRVERSLEHGAEGGDRLAAEGQRILVSAGGGTRVMLITLDAAPSILRRAIPLGLESGDGGAVQLGLRGDHAWVGQGKVLRELVLEGPQGSPRFVDRHEGFFAGQWARRGMRHLGERLLVSEEGVLRLYDTSGDGAPSLRQELTMIGPTEDLAVAGPLVFAANGRGGLQVLLARPDVLPWQVLLPWAGVGR